MATPNATVPDPCRVCVSIDNGSAKSRRGWDLGIYRCTGALRTSGLGPIPGTQAYQSVLRARATRAAISTSYMLSTVARHFSAARRCEASASSSSCGTDTPSRKYRSCTGRLRAGNGGSCAPALTRMLTCRLVLGIPAHSASAKKQFQQRRLNAERATSSPRYTHDRTARNGHRERSSLA